MSKARIVPVPPPEAALPGSPPLAMAVLPPPEPGAPPLVAAVPVKRKPGRPKGSKSRSTLEREAALAAAMGAAKFDGIADAISLLRAVVKSPAVPLQDRLKAALALAPFEVPRPSPAPPPRDVGPLAKRLREAYLRTGRGDLLPETAPAEAAGPAAEQPPAPSAPDPEALPMPGLKP
jgi:hypothetical protein